MSSMEGDCQFTLHKCEPNNAGFVETGCYHALQWDKMLPCLAMGQDSLWNRYICFGEQSI